MSFVMPSKYGPDLPQAKDPSVTIKEVPSKIVAVAAFPGPSVNLFTSFQLAFLFQIWRMYSIALTFMEQQSI